MNWHGVEKIVLTINIYSDVLGIAYPDRTVVIGSTLCDDEYSNNIFAWVRRIYLYREGKSDNEAPQS